VRSARVRGEIEDALSIPGEEAIEASAKEGIGTIAVLEAVIARIPPPSAIGRRAAGDDFRFSLRIRTGIIAYVRVRKRPVACRHAH